jgi:hypothetical protein
MVFGTVAEAGDATEVAPTNIPANSAPITLFLRIELFLRIDMVFPFRWALFDEAVGRGHALITETVPLLKLVM